MGTRSSTGLPFSPRRVGLYVLLAVLVMTLNEWWARRVGRESAEAERASVAAQQAALRFRQSRLRYDSAAKAARTSVAQATVARQRVRIVGPKTLEVEGTPVPVLVPPQVVEVIARQDTALALSAVALLQADTALARAEGTIAAQDTLIRAIRRRVPRLGFRAGFVAGVAVVLSAAVLLGR
jgi:hypothetical protein